MPRIKVFSDRYPFLGPSIWILTVEYFIIQLIAAAAWHNPAYSWRNNTISDLGNTACGSTISSRLVCSPLHTLMNAAFIALGLLMAAGALLIYQEFREKPGTLLGFSLMAMAGFGTLLVGLFPENTVRLLHILGAGLPFLLGNISLVILSFSLYKISRWMRLYTFISGAAALAALALLLSRHYVDLGIGGMERLVSYPQTIWLIFF